MRIVKLGLSGESGKMGQAIQDFLKINQSQFTIIAKINSASTISDIQHLCRVCDVVIDFSHRSVVKDLIYFSAQFSTNIFIGTTQLEEEHFDFMQLYAQDIALVYSYNTSLGANLLENLSIKASTILHDYDTEILDIHHKHKKDSPSGTALAIGKSIAATRGINFNTHAIFDRHIQGVRHKDDITFASIRGGEICGDHQVMFAGKNEVMTISHRALSRRSFVEGSLYAANWLVDRAPGLYSMKDVFDL